MKKIIIFMSVLLFASDTKEILQMIHILQTQQFEYKPLRYIYDPFSQQAKDDYKEVKIIKPVQKNTNYKLEVIFQNKARINKNWYKNGDKLDDYTIIIHNNKVYLKKNNKYISLEIKHIIKVQ